MRGRRPKPTQLHRLHGTFNPTKHAKGRAQEPLPEGDLAAPPNWFTPGQCESWDYAIQHSPKGVMKAIDRGVLALWCTAEARHREAEIAQAELNRRGPDLPYLVKGPDGLMISPYIEVIDRAAKIMSRCIVELGFSPCSRPRVKVDQSPAQGDGGRADPWSVLRVIPGGRGSEKPA